MNSQLEPQIPSTELSVGNFLNLAWKNTYGIKWQVIWPLLIVSIVGFLAVVIAISFFNNQLPETVNSIEDFPSNLLLILGIISIITLIITWFVTAALTVLGVYRANNLVINFSDAFTECKKVLGQLSIIFVASFLISFAMNFIKYFIPEHGAIAFLLQLIVFIVTLYLALPLSVFAIPFVVTQKLPGMQAIKESYRLMKMYAPLVMLTFIVMIILLVVSAIPLGIGLIWTLPMTYALQGLMFTLITGKKVNLPTKL